LIRIAAYSSLQERDIDVELAREVLKKSSGKLKMKTSTQRIFSRLSVQKTGIKISDIKSQKKNKNIVLSRQLAMYITRKLTGLFLSGHW